MVAGILWLAVRGLLLANHLLVEVLEGVLAAMVLVILIVVAFGILREASHRRK